MKFNGTFTGLRSLKGRGLPGLNRRPLDLQSKTVPLSYILYKLLHGSSKIQGIHISPFFSFAFVAFLQQALVIFYRNGGSEVEFSPVTRETGVRFLANAFTI